MGVVFSQSTDLEMYVLPSFLLVIKVLFLLTNIHKLKVNSLLTCMTEKTLNLFEKLKPEVSFGVFAQTDRNNLQRAFCQLMDYT